MRSVVMGGQRPLGGLADGPAVPDAGGQGQQPLGDAGIDAFGGAAVVAFEVELALEGVVRPTRSTDRAGMRLRAPHQGPGTGGGQRPRFSTGRGWPRSSFLRRVIGDRRLWPADSAYVLTLDLRFCVLGLSVVPVLFGTG